MKDFEDIAKTALTLIACTALGACSAADRIAQIGQAPALAPINNPTLQEDYQPVSLPMPAPKKIVKQKNSLWQADRVTFFEHQLNVLRRQMHAVSGDFHACFFCGPELEKSKHLLVCFQLVQSGAFSRRKNPRCKRLRIAVPVIVLQINSNIGLIA